MQKWLFPLFIFVVCIVGCKKQAVPRQAACTTSTQIPGGYNTSSFTEVTYNQNHCGYLPLGKNNYWIYLDSIFDVNGQFQRSFLDTIRFTKTYQTPDGIIWWSLDRPGELINNYAGYPKYNYSTDSIAYGTAFAWGGSSGYKWFYSIGSSFSLSESIPYSDVNSPCNAQRVNTPIQVPAGNFLNCIFFNKKLVYGTGVEFSTWFKPGVGVLRTDMFLGSVRTSTAWLVSYYIE
jgi:hypothetical protein